MSSSEDKDFDVSHLAKRRELRKYLECVFPAAATVVAYRGKVDNAAAAPPRASNDATLTAFAQLGALRLNTKTAVISLLDRDFQWVIAEATRTISLQDSTYHANGDGLVFGTVAIPIKCSLCAWSVAHTNSHNFASVGAELHLSKASDAAFMVNDLSLDDRFKESPSVAQSPYLRFMASIPLISPKSGQAIGSYCVLDDKPRDVLGTASLRFMKDMATTIVCHLEQTRATLEKSRCEKMVRGIGAFVEGQGSIRDWWERTSSDLGKSIPRARATADYFAHSSGIGAGSSVGPSKGSGSERLASRINLKRSASASLDESSKSLNKRSDHLSSNAIALISQSRMNRQPSPSTGEKPSPKVKSPGVKDLVSRAANIIREATELDGVLFLDARMASLRTGRTGAQKGATTSHNESSEGETSPSSSGDDPNRPCRIIGMSSNESNDEDEVSPATSLALFPEKSLRWLLKKYPKGRIISIEEASSASESEVSIGSVEADEDLDAAPNRGDRQPRKKTGVNISRANQAAIMAKTFPGARSVVFFPLWDNNKERWFSAAFAYSCSSLRELTIEDELSFLAGFGNSIMAAVSRLDALQADNAKADFIGSISHELRSPLHGILGSVEMLRESLLDTLQSDLLHNIQVCGRTLLDTVDHLLDFSKTSHLLRPQTTVVKSSNIDGAKAVSGSTSTSHIADLDLAILCEEAMQAVSSSHFLDDSRTEFTKDDLATSVALILDIDESHKSMVRGQPGAIKRIVSNLISNSQKYTKTGFIILKLKIEPSPVPAEETGVEDESPYRIHIIVQDSGQGISKRFLRDRLFTPFQQEDPHSEGTGLGLSIIRQILSSLRGTINIESVKDQGTTVHISLPLALAEGDIEFRQEREEVATTRQVVSNKTVTLIGFDSRLKQDAGNRPSAPLSSTERGLALLGNSIASFCQTSLGLRVLPLPSDSLPDMYVLHLASAKQYADLLSNSPTPVVIVCPTMSIASHWIKMKSKATSNRLHYVAQPIGPLRLAKLVRQIFSTQEAASPLSPEEAWPWHQTPLVPSLTHSPLEVSRPSKLPGSRGYVDQPAPTSLQSSPTTPMSPRWGMSSANRTSRQYDVEATYIDGAPYVLCVDDNEINRRLLETFCKRLSLPHASASNGREAFDAFKAAWNLEQPFTHVLMDVNMPVMNGMEATREIRQFEKNEESRSQSISKLVFAENERGEKRRSAIIALTGLTSSSSQEDAFASGMDLFLSKPVKFAQLKDILQNALERQQLDEKSTINP